MKKKKKQPLACRIINRGRKTEEGSVKTEVICANTQNLPSHR